MILVLLLGSRELKAKRVRTNLFPPKQLLPWLYSAIPMVLPLLEESTCSSLGPRFNSSGWHLNPY
jgi:hypothetical protein